MALVFLLVSCTILSLPPNTITQQEDVIKTSTVGTQTHHIMSGFPRDSQTTAYVTPGAGVQQGGGLAGLLGQVLGGGGLGGNGLPASLQQIMVLGATKAALGTANVSQHCQDDIMRLISGLGTTQTWALKVIDAAGKPSSGILETIIEPHRFLGNYDECVGIEAPGNDVISRSFKGRYCMAEVTLEPTIGKATILEGLCVSDQCSGTDVDHILAAAQKTAFGSTYFKTETYCHTDKKLGNDAIAVIVVLSLLGFLLVTGTLYDVISVQLKWTTGTEAYEHPASAQLVGIKNRGCIAGCEAEANIKMEMVGDDCKQNGLAGPQIVPGTCEEAIKTVPNEVVGSNGVVGNGVVSTTDVKLDVQNSIAGKYKNTRGLVGQMLLAFSVYSNGKKILSTEQGAGTLGAVNGIRFLSMAWVILGHTYFFSRGYEKNLIKHVVDKMQDWTFMFIPYATVSVDSFFCLSGILVAYLTLKHLKKVGGASKMNWLMFYFHRFWRLTPPYMLVIMVGTVLFPYMSSGPTWSTEDLPAMASCRENWWVNLLYVNNFVKVEQMCMGWSWYLANDMQFYIVSPLFLIPLFYNAFAGAAVSVLFLAASLVTTGLIAKQHEYNAQFLVDALHPPKDGNYMKNLYFPSYARLGPYLVGLVVGYLLYRWACKLPEMSSIPAGVKRLLNLTFLTMCIAVCCVIIYVPFNPDYDRIWSFSNSAVYISLSRTVWSVAVGWIVLACACGYGGWINELLSWKAFIPLGRLTYCAYLVHPLVMMFYGSSARVPYYFTDFSATYLFFANMVTSYGVAFVTSLAFESPMMGLEKAILGK